ncbi:MAG: hypothetical protein ABSF59_14705 [Candidatus Sulfotelmatobacter sp.]|jgi:hypothetical protein
MKRACPTLLLCALATASAAQIGVYQPGSVVRMRMGDCMAAQHGLMATFGAPANATSQEACPEYTLVSSSVVYVIVGRSSNQLIPLAETIDFRFHKNELLVRIDDAKKESKFTIKEMLVRSDWDRLQRHIDQQLKADDVREAQR